MLFLTKKTMVSVLALGTLLSVAPKMQADAKSDALSNFAQEGLYIGGALLTAHLNYHKPDHSKKDKHVLLKAYDAAATHTQSVVNFLTSANGLKTVGVGVVAYLLLKHRGDVTELGAVKGLGSLLSKAPNAAPTHHHHLPTPPPASN